MTDFIDHAFSAEQFRTQGHVLIDILAEYLHGNLSGNGKVLNWQTPAAAWHAFKRPLPKQACYSADQWLAAIRDQILPANLQIHHPHSMGHQVAPPLPMAALADLVASLTNQAMAVYETGPSATLLEKQVITWLGELIGWNKSDGVLTSGGAQANLTALLAARQIMCAKHGLDVWKHGLSQSKPLCILTSEHAHYSVSRAAGMMGMGTDAVIMVATDQDGRMRMDALAIKYQEALARGELPFAVVAMAGCTPTGSIDPLAAIGRFCEQHQIWMHVDGVHGASALLSKTHKPKLTGIELADSVAWDGHKLMYMPAMISAVIYHNPEHSYAAFNQEASYLFQGHHQQDEAYNLSYRTLECTKRMMALKLWSAFMLYGTDGMGQLVDQVFASAQRLAEMLRTSEAFELLMMPETNIVCFRHIASRLDIGINQHQSSLRNHMMQQGFFHLTQVKFHDEIWLRVTIMNPMTDQKCFTDFIAAFNASDSLSHH